MALVKVKPTSPGRRAVVQVVNPNLHKGKPFAPLVEAKSGNAGRNNNGRITVRHQGGGHKQAYRVIDFKRNKDGIPAKVERLEYDPNRTANIALLCYADGERTSPERRRIWPVKVRMPRFASAPAKCVACMSNVAPPSVKLATKSTTCASSVKPVLCVGVVFARPFAVRP